jgi:PhnB protein
MTTVNPYLTFNGNCEDAFNFYKSVFGGEFTYFGRFKEMPDDTVVPEEFKEKILHVSLPVSNETVLMGSDTDPVFAPTVTPGNNISLSINAETEDDAKRFFSALSDGGRIIMPLEKTFWGALYGMFTDKFGINWIVNYDYNASK